MLLGKGLFQVVAGLWTLFGFFHPKVLKQVILQSHEHISFLTRLEDLLYDFEIERFGIHETLLLGVTQVLVVFSELLVKFFIRQIKELLRLHQYLLILIPIIKHPHHEIHVISILGRSSAWRVPLLPLGEEAEFWGFWVYELIVTFAVKKLPVDVILKVDFDFEDVWDKQKWLKDLLLLVSLEFNAVGELYLLPVLILSLTHLLRFLYVIQISMFLPRIEAQFLFVLDLRLLRRYQRNRSSIRLLRVRIVEAGIRLIVFTELLLVVSDHVDDLAGFEDLFILIDKGDLLRLIFVLVLLICCFGLREAILLFFSIRLISTKMGKGCMAGSFKIWSQRLVTQNAAGDG